MEHHFSKVKEMGLLLPPDNPSLSLTTPPFKAKWRHLETHFSDIIWALIDFLVAINRKITLSGVADHFAFKTFALLNHNFACFFFFFSISEDEGNMDQNVGYCPQYDALDEMLTGKEMLYFYGRLKGIPRAALEQVCSQYMWICLWPHCGIFISYDTLLKTSILAFSFFSPKQKRIYIHCNAN